MRDARGREEPLVEGPLAAELDLRVARPDDAQLLGISFVQDMSTYSMFQMKFGMSQQAKMSARQKKAASLSQDAMPLKYGHFYIVDAPWYFSVAWAIIKNFMKKKRTFLIAIN